MAQSRPQRSHVRSDLALPTAVALRAVGVVDLSSRLERREKGANRRQYGTLDLAQPQWLTLGKVPPVKESHATGSHNLRRDRGSLETFPVRSTAGKVRIKEHAARTAPGSIRYSCAVNYGPHAADRKKLCGTGQYPDRPGRRWRA